MAKKKVLALLLTTAMAASLLSGCGGGVIQTPQMTALRRPRKAQRVRILKTVQRIPEALTVRK